MFDSKNQILSEAKDLHNSYLLTESVWYQNRENTLIHPV